MKKYIIGFILGAIIFGTIGVYAAINYEASQIVYKSTTLDKAIDELYTTQNGTVSNLESELHSYKDSLVLRLLGYNYVSSSFGDSQLNFTNGNVKNLYKYFKIKSKGTFSGSPSSCEIKVWSDIQSKLIDINVNTEYNIWSSTDGYKFSTIILYIRTPNNNAASCYADIEFYNK